ncbi:MAG: hypothetical protein ACKVT0_04855 [Planctomycetaceae bacterium]
MTANQNTNTNKPSPLVPDYYSPEPSSWDLSQERQFIENLLCQRFNFLLVFYSLIVAGSLTTSVFANFIAVLFLGALICSLLVLPTARAQYRLNAILNFLKHQDGHACNISDKLIEDEKSLEGLCCCLRLIVKYSQRNWIGYWIPMLCAGTLWLAFFMALCGALKPGQCS